MVAATLVPSARCSLVTLVALVASVLLACEPERPPTAKDDRPVSEAADSAAPAPLYDPATTSAVLTFAGERGAFQDTSKPDSIAENARGLVRVTLLDGPAPPPGKVWVGNFKGADASGKVQLTTVARDDFEELALGQGLSSQVELPEGLEPPAQVANAHGDVIVYKTAWCGVCKKLEGYLGRKGVVYTAKDIEKDPSAAAELQAKASAKGMRTGSVPVIDVRGELLVGFDRARLEALL